MPRPRLPITHLHHVTLRMPDPGGAAVFYQRVFGLAETGRTKDPDVIRLSTLRHGAQMVSPHEFVLCPGESAALDHLALAVLDEAALAQTADLLRRRGITVDGPQEFDAVCGRSLRVRDPDGLTVELLVAPQAVPRPAGDPPCELVKLHHVNVKSPDPPRRARWWQEVMNFRLSDQMGETFYWLRCNHEHTTVAIVRSATPGIHHLAVEIASWDELRRLADHLASHQVPIEFGPGRHGPGHSIFLYVLDPWRIRWEFLCDIERIAGDAAHRPTQWDQARRAQIVNLWGPAPPQTFLQW